MRSILDTKDFYPLFIKTKNMKKTIIVFAVLTSITLTNQAIAQDVNIIDFREKLTIGAKAGLNLSNVYDSRGEEFDADAKFGWAVGGFVAIPFGKFIGFQPELLLSQKGFQATGSFFGSPYSFTRTTTYIDVPLLIALKPTEFITFLVGPQYSYLTKQSDVFTSSSTSMEQQTAFDNDNIRKNTLCFTGGVDFTLKHMVVGVRAGWDVQNNNGNGTSTIPRYKNMWYQATLGYRF